MNKIESLDLWKGDMLSTVNVKVMLSAVKANKARDRERWFRLVWYIEWHICVIVANSDF